MHDLVRNTFSPTHREQAMTHRTILSATAFICLMIAAATAPAVCQQAGPTIVAIDGVQWNPTPVPGVKGTTIVGNPRSTGPYVVLAKYDPGVKAPPHTHPDQRVVTVISGTFYAGAGTEFDESTVKPLKPGTIIVIPANAPHYGWAKDGEVIIEEAGFGPSGVNVVAKTQTK